MVINGKVIMPRMGREMPEKMITHSQENYEKGFKLLDKTLEGKTYLLDDELTLLDFWLVEMMINCVMIELDFEQDYPNLHKYYKGILEKVAVLKEDEVTMKEVLDFMREG